MNDIVVTVTGDQGTGKSLLLEMLEVRLAQFKIPYTYSEDHVLRVNMGQYIEKNKKVWNKE